MFPSMTLKQLRKRCGWNPEIVATKARVSCQMLRNVEAGVYVPRRLSTQERYARAYGLTLKQFLAALEAG
jgi:transcriptional regulator with XRE-family HTH domain